MKLREGRGGLLLSRWICDIVLSWYGSCPAAVQRGQQCVEAAHGQSALQGGTLMR